MYINFSGKLTLFSRDTHTYIYLSGVTNVSFSEILVCTKWITPLVKQSSMLCDFSNLMKTYLLRCNELKDCLQFLFSYLANLSE